MSYGYRLKVSVSTAGSKLCSCRRRLLGLAREKNCAMICRLICKNINAGKLGAKSADKQRTAMANIWSQAAAVSGQCLQAAAAAAIPLTDNLVTGGANRLKSPLVQVIC